MRQAGLDAAEHGAVLRRPVVAIIRAHHAARAGHELDDDGGAARNVAAEKIAENAGIGAGGAAGIGRRNQDDSLPGEEIFLGAGVGRGKGDSEGREKQREKAQAMEKPVHGPTIAAKAGARASGDASRCRLKPARGFVFFSIRRFCSARDVPSEEKLIFKERLPKNVDSLALGCGGFMEAHNNQQLKKHRASRAE